MNRKCGLAGDLAMDNQLRDFGYRGRSVISQCARHQPFDAFLNSHSMSWWTQSDSWVYTQFGPTKRERLAALTIRRTARVDGQW